MQTKRGRRRGNNWWKKDYLIVDKAYKSVENIVNFSFLYNIDLNQNFNSLKLTIKNMLLNDKSKQLKITDFLK